MSAAFLRRYVAHLIYAALFCVSLFFFVSAGIGAPAVKAKLKDAVYGAMGAEMEIAELAVSFPFRIAAKGVAVRDKNGTELFFERVNARLLFAPLFLGRVAVRASADTGGGPLTLEAARKWGSVTLKMAASGFALRSALRKAGGVPLPLDAALDVEGEIDMPGGLLSAASGEIRVSAKNMKLDAGALGNAFFAASLIRKIEPRSLSCAIALEKGNVETKGCSAATAAGGAELKLSTRLAENIGDTPLRGSLVLTPSEPGGVLEAVLSAFPKYKKQDGSYHIPVNGTLSSPAFAL